MGKKSGKDTEIQMSILMNRWTQGFGFGSFFNIIVIKNSSQAMKLTKGNEISKRTIPNTTGVLWMMLKKKPKQILGGI